MRLSWLACVLSVTWTSRRCPKELNKDKDIAVKLPVELKDYWDVFRLKEAEKLLLHQLYNYNIKLKDG